jgi:RNA polymerase sigma factor (sigma-70 family)
MGLLPSRTYSDQVASNILTEVKKGNRQALGEFIWQNQERFYAIAFMATDNPSEATHLTTKAFSDVMAAARQVNPKQMFIPLWEWLAQFIVAACAEWHYQHSGPPATSVQTDPTNDGSGDSAWGDELALGGPKLKRCMALLPDEQRKVFVLRHQLGLNYDQISQVLNQNGDNVMVWLFRARVQLLKCLSH